MTHVVLGMQDITSSSGVAAVGNFFGILVGSTVIGVVFGFLATFTFKYVHLAHESNGVQETAVLLMYAYGSYVFGTCRLAYQPLP